MNVFLLNNTYILLHVIFIMIRLTILIYNLTIIQDNYIYEKLYRDLNFINCCISLKNKSRQSHFF